MRIDVLQEFVTVVKSRGFNRAAKNLHLSQSSLSTHISSLEKDLGFKLFDRTAQPPALTLSGQIFLEYAQGIVSLYQEGKTKGADAANKAPVRIAEIPSSSFLYKKISSVELGDTVQFVKIPEDMLPLEALEAGLVDIAIVPELTTRTSDFEAYAEKYLYIPLGFQKMAMAYDISNPFLTRRPLERTDLNGITAIITDTTYFDFWTQMIHEIIGEDISLTTRLKLIMNNESELSRSRLDNDVYICNFDRTTKAFENRGDIAVVDQIGDTKLQFACGILCRADRTDEATKRVIIMLKEAAKLARNDEAAS